MLDTIYCRRFGQRSRRAAFVVLSAASPRILQASAARPQTAETSRTRQFFACRGLAVREPLPPCNYNAGRNLIAAGSDDERSQGGRHVPNDAPTVPSSVLDQDIAGRQHHLRAIVELEYHVAGEEDPEIRRVGPMKAVVSSAGFVAILELHLGSGFWCNHAGQVRPYDVADATYGWEYTGRRRIVPRVRVGCGL